MKKLHYLLFAMIMGLAVSFTSCSSDNDSPLDPIDPVDPTPEVPVANKTIAELRALTTGDAVEVPADFIFKGIVVSSQSESNNFYQAIYLQDGDVAVKISCLKEGDKFYETLVNGQEVFVKAAGLFMAKYYDTYTLGYQATTDKYKVSRIPEVNLKAVAIGGELNKNITPKEVNDISALTPDMVGTFVKVNNVQVVEDHKGKKLGDKDNSGYTTIKFTTADKQSISLSNNNFAEFNEALVPEGLGSISGILNTFGTDFQIALTSLEGLDLEGERFVVESSVFVDKTVDALEEMFSTGTADERVDVEGWFTEAVVGAEFWEVKEYSSAKYIQTSGYQSGQDAIETWVVSPGLNLDATDSKKNFSFDSKRGYTKAEVLKVLVSSDFDYNTGVAAATWEELTVTFPAENGSGYTDWLNSGVIDLSGKTGKVHVAFKYVGNQTDATGTWQVGNVKFNYTLEDNGGGETGSEGADTDGTIYSNIENFDNSALTNSYADGSFDGANAITWTYVGSRDQNGDANSSGIAGNAIMLRRASSDSKITSSSISGGIKNFTVKMYKGFTGGGNRQIELFVNGVSVGKSVAFDDLVKHECTFEGINVSGDFTLEIRNLTEKQVIIDDISWENM